MNQQVDSAALAIKSGSSRWTQVAVRTGLLAAELSRRAGLGEGSIIGGRVTLALDRRALRRLSADRHVVLVSGTNGKTTTSHLLASAFRSRGPVAHNATGSNMGDGVVAALTQARDAKYAVLEVDELHLAAIADAVDPAGIIVLNLTRDQLDRSTEVRKTAAAITRAVADRPATSVFANADDPMTVWAVGEAARTVWVAAGSRWRGDTLSCPRCGEYLTDSEEGRWHCVCGLTRPDPHWWIRGETVHTCNAAARLSLQLPGQFNLGNAAFALAAAQAGGVPLSDAAEAMSGVDQVAGRYTTIRRGPHTLRLFLAKNPAGWAAMLSMLAPQRPLLIAINAREADGRDTSWLWDVEFDRLDSRPIAASGERAADLGIRLSYAGHPHHTDTDPLQALALLPPGEVDVVANYSAFRSLHHCLIDGS